MTLNKSQEIEEAIRKNYKFLDTINFLPYIDACSDIQDLIQLVEKDYYTNHYDSIPEEYEGYVFCDIDDYEVMKYLEERYHLNICEETITKYRIVK